MASPALADHGLAPVTADTKCRVALTEGVGGQVVMTGALVDPPSLYLELTFGSRARPVALTSDFRGSHAYLSPPGVGPTVFHLSFGPTPFPPVETRRSGLHFRFVFQTFGVPQMSVTGKMEAGPKCRASLPFDGLPDTSASATRDRPFLPPISPAIVLLSGALAGALAWRRRDVWGGATNPN